MGETRTAYSRVGPAFYPSASTFPSDFAAGSQKSDGTGPRTLGDVRREKNTSVAEVEFRRTIS